MNPELQKILNGCKNKPSGKPPQMCGICRQKISKIYINGVQKEVCGCGTIRLPGRQPFKTPPASKVIKRPGE